MCHLSHSPSPCSYRPAVAEGVHFDSIVRPTTVAPAVAAGLSIPPHLVNVTYAWNCSVDGIVHGAYMMVSGCDDEGWWWWWWWRCRGQTAYLLASTTARLAPQAALVPDDFEKAVLAAVNGAGNNMARAACVGALVGAQVGLSGIPRRFVDGLVDGHALRDAAVAVATAAHGSGAA